MTVAPSQPPLVTEAPTQPPLVTEAAFQRPIVTVPPNQPLVTEPETDIDREPAVKCFDEMKDNDRVHVIQSQDDVPEVDLSKLDEGFHDLVANSPLDTSLLQIAEDGETLGLNSILTKENWDYLLLANELSYAAAKTHTVESDAKKFVVDRRLNEITDILEKSGWSDFSILFGATGADNVDQDASCIVMYHKEKNLVYVAFHGSRNGSKFNIFSAKGDWGANYRWNQISAREHGLEGAPEGVFIHEGFGKNFLSVQKVLLLKLLDIVLNKVTLEKKPTIIVTGHSKGGAEASIAVPVIKHLFRMAPIVKVYGVTLSAPVAFNTAGANWVQNTVGSRNILRLYVPFDPVTTAGPIRDYVHVGFELEDDINQVNIRSAHFLGMNPADSMSWGNRLANYHYGVCHDGGCGFVSDIPMRHFQLEAHV